MANTVLTRLCSASDDVILSLESFGELLSHVDKDHKQEFISAAAGDASPVVKQAMGTFFDQNVGAESFKDSVTAFFKSLMDKIKAYYARVREFIISYVGVSVKRIERMVNNIKKSEKYKDLGDVGMSLKGLYGIGYETEQKSLSYMFLDSPPDRLLLEKFNRLPEITKELANINTTGDEAAMTRSVRMAIANTVYSVKQLDVTIKPNISDAENAADAKFSFSAETAKTQFNETLKPGEVEIKVNAKAFVNAIDNWAKLLNNAQDLLKSNKKTGDIVKSMFDKMKSKGFGQMQELMNSVGSLVAMQTVYSNYLLAAFNQYIDTTFKVLAHISRSMGVTVIRANASVESADITDSTIAIHSDVVRHASFTDPDNQFFASLERAWTDDEAEDAEYTFVPKEEPATTDNKKSEGFLVRAQEALIKLWEKIKTLVFSFIDKIVSFITGRQHAQRLYSKKIKDLSNAKLPSEFMYTVPKKYNGFSPIDYRGNFQSIALTDVMDSMSEIIWRLVIDVNEAEFRKRKTPLDQIFITTRKRPIERYRRAAALLKGVNVNDGHDPSSEHIREGDALPSLRIVPMVENDEAHKVTASVMYQLSKLASSNDISRTYANIMKKAGTATGNLKVMMKKMDNTIKKNKKTTEEIDKLSVISKSIPEAMRAISTLLSQATLIFDAHVHLIDSAIKATSSSGNESVSVDVDADNVDVVDIVSAVGEFSADADKVTEEDKQIGLEALLLDHKPASNNTTSGNTEPADATPSKTEAMSAKAKSMWQRFVDFIKRMWERIVATTKNMAKRIMEFIRPIELRASLVAAKAAGIKKLTLPEKMEFTITPETSRHTMVDDRGNIIHDMMSSRIKLAIMIETAIEKSINSVGFEMTGKMESGSIIIIDPNHGLNNTQKVIHYVDELANTFKNTGAELKVTDFVVDADKVKEGEVPFFKFPSLSITVVNDSSVTVSIDKKDILKYADELVSKQSVLFSIVGSKAITNDILNTLSKLDKTAKTLAKKMESGAFKDLEEAKRDIRQFTGMTSSALQLMNFIISMYSGAMVSNERLVKHIYANRVKKKILGMGKEDHTDDADAQLDKEMDEWMLVPTSETEYDQDDKSFALVSQGVEDYADPAPEPANGNNGAKGNWEAIIQVSRDKESALHKELTSIVEIIDAAEKQLHVAKTKDQTGQVNLTVPAAFAADCPYSDGSDKGEAVVTARMKIVTDVAYDICDLLYINQNVIQNPDNIKDSLPELDKLTLDIVTDLKGIGSTYANGVGLQAIPKQYGLPLVKINKPENDCSVTMPVESYTQVNSAGLSNLIVVLAEAAKGLRHALDNSGKVMDVAQTHILDVQNIETSLEASLKSSASDYADVMVALTALIHCVKATASNVLIYLSARNQLGDTPSQESYEKLNYLKNYITASLESGGLMVAEVAAINMMSGFLSDAFGLEDFEMDDSMFFERSDRESSTQMLLDKLATV